MLDTFNILLSLLVVPVISMSCVQLQYIWQQRIVVNCKTKSLVCPVSQMDYEGSVTSMDSRITAMETTLLNTPKLLNKSLPDFCHDDTNYWRCPLRQIYKLRWHNRRSYIALVTRTDWY